MSEKAKTGDQDDPNLDELSIDRPRLTPQGHASGKAEGEDSTNPMGPGAKQGQGDKAEASGREDRSMRPPFRPALDARALHLRLT
jgi:hypothetical protein